MSKELDEYLAELIVYLYPGIKPLEDFTLVNHGDRTFIESWSYSGTAEPSLTSLESLLVIHKAELDARRVARANSPTDEEVFESLIKVAEIHGFLDPVVEDILTRRKAAIEAGKDVIE